MSASGHPDASLTELLCSLESATDISFAANAQQIVYSTALPWGQRKGKHALSTIWLAETGKPSSSRRLTDGKSNDHFPRWQPGTSDTVAWISDHEKRGTAMVVRRTKLSGGSEAHVETCVRHEGEISRFEFQPKVGETIVYLANRDLKPSSVSVGADDDELTPPLIWGEDKNAQGLWLTHAVSAAQGATRDLSRLISPEDRHVIDFAWNTAGTMIAMVHAASSHIEEPFLHGVHIDLVDLTVNSKEDVKSAITHLGSFPSLVHDLIWPVNDKLYFRGPTPPDRACAAGMGLYSVDCSASSATHPCYSLTAGFGMENDAENVRAVDGEVVVHAQYRLENRLYLAGGQRILFQKTQDLSAFAAAFATDSDEMVLAVAMSDVNTPTEVYSTTVSGGGLVRLSDHGAAFRDRTFGSFTALTCQSEDAEVELDAVYLSPYRSDADQKERSPLPTLVNIHGGPNMQITNSFNPAYFMWSPYLLHLGFGILFPNYRGSSGRGRAFAAYSYGVGTYDYADVITLTDLAITEGYADKDRLIVGGWSQGGYLSYLSSVRNGLHNKGWRFRAAIPGAGVTDWGTLSLTSDVGASLEFELNGGHTPWTSYRNSTEGRNGSALWEFQAAVQKEKETGQTIIPPMLILHGEKDERCPLTQAWGMRRALSSQMKEFEMITYPDQPHMIQQTAYWVDMATRVGNWCQRWIGESPE